MDLNSWICIQSSSTSAFNIMLTINNWSFLRYTFTIELNRIILFFSNYPFWQRREFSEDINNYLDPDIFYQIFQHFDFVPKFTISII